MINRFAAIIIYSFLHSVHALYIVAMASINPAVDDDTFGYLKSAPDTTLADPAYSFVNEEVFKEGGDGAPIVPGRPVHFSFKDARHVSLSKSYFEIRVRINEQDARRLKFGTAIGDGTSQVAPAPYLPSTLFSSLDVSVAGTSVENIGSSTFAQVAAYQFRNMDKEDQDGEYGAMNGWGESFDTPAARVVPYSRTKTLTYFWKPPSALWRHNGPLPNNTPVRLTLNVHPAAGNRALTGTAAATAVASDKLSGAAQNDNTVGFNIDNITLRLAVAEGVAADAAAASGQTFYPLKRVECITTPITQPAATAHRMQVDQKTHRLSFAFQQQTAEDGTANHNAAVNSFQTQVAAHEARPTSIALKSLQVRFAGHTAPDRPFMPVISDEEENLRIAFKEYEATIPAMVKETYEQWLARGPIFSYRHVNVRGGDDKSTEVTVHTELDPATPALNLLTFHENEATLVLDSQGGNVVAARVLEA
jgi:hypothetical protein